MAAKRHTTNDKPKVKVKTTFEQEYNRIGEINLQKGVTPALGLCKLFEEAGELAQAVNVKIGIKNGSQKTVKANVTEECADMIQNALSIANLFRIKPQELLNELQRKNTTWELVKRKTDPKKNAKS